MVVQVGQIREMKVGLEAIVIILFWDWVFRSTCCFPALSSLERACCVLLKTEGIVGGRDHCHQPKSGC